MAGTRELRSRGLSGNRLGKLICCGLVTATVLGLAAFQVLLWDRTPAGAASASESIDFSSLAPTVVRLDEYGTSGTTVPVAIASSAMRLSSTSGVKSDFRETTGSVALLVVKHAGQLQRHLERGLRTAADPEDAPGGKPAVVAASWRPAGSVAEINDGGPKRVGSMSPAGPETSDR